MSKSAIYTVNQTAQDVAENGTINLGSIIRRYGCNLNLTGNAILVDGAGYYDIESSITLVPAAAGTVTVSMQKDGIAVPGATASATVAATDTTVAIPITAMVRENCACCEGASNLTLVLTGGAATVNNIAVKAEKL